MNSDMHCGTKRLRRMNVLKVENDVEMDLIWRAFERGLSRIGEQAGIVSAR